MRNLNWNQFFNLGDDTERWWREHVRQTMPHLKHVKSKGYDFRGDYDDAITFIDVKFCRTQYRRPGWIEVTTRGKITGIIKTAEIAYNHDEFMVGIVVMECGHWYLLDVVEMLRAWRDCKLQLHESSVWDEAQGARIKAKNFQLDGWADDRFLICQGPLRKELWNPRTEIGRRIDIDAWMAGDWKLNDEENKNVC
jgi:hypothetical protein